MKLVTAEEMKKIDTRAIEGMSIPGAMLMENAGRGVVSVIKKGIGEVEGVSFAIVCGKGNNGGDGFVVARFLKNDGASIRAYLLGRKSEVKGDAKTNLEIALKAGVELVEVRSDASLSKLGDGLGSADVAVDAIFGTGFKGAPGGIPGKAIDLLNQFEGIIVSIDVPSGLDASTGQIGGPCVLADVTVTMCLPKRGLLLYPGKDHTGDLYVVDIGIPPLAIEKEHLKVELIEDTYVRSVFPMRPSGAHKGRFGHLLVVAGSPGLTGAGALASMSGLKVGCGLVTLGIPESLNDLMEAKLTEVMTLPLKETRSRTLAREALDSILSFLEKADALALGPGLSTNPKTRELVLKLLPEVNCPTIVDADGLNNLSYETSVIRQCKAPLVLTPHPGEASRLIGVKASGIDLGRIDYAVKMSKGFSSTVVLKGAPTVVASMDGLAYVNPTGNSGMATGGSGDVLTGMIGGFLAQGLNSLEASTVAVYLHGLAGDLGAEEHTEYSLVAGDIMENIPSAIKECLGDLLNESREEPKRSHCIERED